MPKQATVKVKQNITVIRGNKDVPKKVAVNHEHLLEAAVVVKPDTHQMMEVTNTIVFIRRKVKKTLMS